ncbi:hypothetical protein SNEBB_001690 [Seison nebaliae]|nr:hypothetical protein SNEBB_001690 [Seison nebaliae]
MLLVEERDAPHSLQTSQQLSLHPSSSTVSELVVMIASSNVSPSVGSSSCLQTTPSSNHIINSSAAMEVDVSSNLVYVTDDVRSATTALSSNDCVTNLLMCKEMKKNKRIPSCKNDENELILINNNNNNNNGVISINSLTATTTTTTTTTTSAISTCTDTNDAIITSLSTSLSYDEIKLMEENCGGNKSVNKYRKNRLISAVSPTNSLHTTITSGIVINDEVESSISTLSSLSSSSSSAAMPSIVKQESKIEQDIDESNKKEITLVGEHIVDGFVMTVFDDLDEAIKFQREQIEQNIKLKEMEEREKNVGIDEDDNLLSQSKEKISKRRRNNVKKLVTGRQLKSCSTKKTKMIKGSKTDGNEVNYSSDKVLEKLPKNRIDIKEKKNSGKEWKEKNKKEKVKTKNNDESTKEKKSIVEESKLNLMKKNEGNEKKFDISKSMESSEMTRNLFQSNKDLLRPFQTNEMNSEKDKEKLKIIERLMELMRKKQNEKNNDEMMKIDSPISLISQSSINSSKIKSGTSSSSNMSGIGGLIVNSSSTSTSMLGTNGKRRNSLINNDVNVDELSNKRMKMTIRKSELQLSIERARNLTRCIPCAENVLKKDPILLQRLRQPFTLGKDKMKNNNKSKVIGENGSRHVQLAWKIRNKKLLLLQQQQQQQQEEEKRKLYTYERQLEYLQQYQQQQEQLKQQQQQQQEQMEQQRLIQEKMIQLVKEKKLNEIQSKKKLKKQRIDSSNVKVNSNMTPEMLQQLCLIQQQQQQQRLMNFQQTNVNSNELYSNQFVQPKNNLTIPDQSSTIPMNHQSLINHYPSNNMSTQPNMINDMKKLMEQQKQQQQQQQQQDQLEQQQRQQQLLLIQQQFQLQQNNVNSVQNLIHLNQQQPNQAINGNIIVNKNEIHNRSKKMINQSAPTQPSSSSSSQPSIQFNNQLLQLQAAMQHQQQNFPNFLPDQKQTLPIQTQHVQQQQQPQKQLQSQQINSMKLAITSTASPFSHFFPPPQALHNPTLHNEIMNPQNMPSLNGDNNNNNNNNNNAIYQSLLTLMSKQMKSEGQQL